MNIKRFYLVPLRIHVLGVVVLAGGVLNLGMLVRGAGASEDETAQFMDMSIEDLLNVEVVSASKKAEKLSDVPSNMVVITDQQIKEWGVKDLKDVLRRVVGYNVVADRDEWCFGARGNVSDNNQKYLVVLDGHRMYSINNFGPGNIIEMPMDLANIKRIEVIKGPGSVVWGNAALSGVISLYTQSPSDMGGKTVHVSTAVGTQDTYRGNFQIGKDVSWGSFMLMGSGAASDGQEVMQSAATSNRPILETKTPSYPDPNGHPYGTYRTDLDRQDPGGMFHAKLNFKDKFLVNAFFLDNATFNRHYESNYGRENFLHNRKYYLEGVYQDELAGGDFTFKVSHHYNLARYNNTQEVSGLPYAQLEKVWVDENYNVAMSYGRVLVKDVLTMNMGLEATHTILGPDDSWSSSSANLSGQTIGANTTITAPTYSAGSITTDKNLSGYALFDWFVTSKFKLVGGSGIDHCDDRGDESLVFSPRAAGIYHWNDTTTTKLVYNHAFLRPSNFQSGVQAEEMDQVEGILIKNFGKTSLTATVYWQKLKGFISIINASTYMNTGDYTSKGVELETTSKVTENVDLWANASYVHATADNFDSTLPVNSIRTDADGKLLSVPDFQFNIGSTLRALDKKFFASPAVRFVNEATYRATPPILGDTTLTTATYGKSDPMAYLDLSLGYEPTDAIGLYATFMNLLDEDGQTYQTIWNGTVGQYGRYMELKAIFKF